MIYSKDGLTKEKLIELLQYSLKQECQFLTHKKPFEFTESIIRVLEIEEKFYDPVNNDGERVPSYRFSVKILVEDKYWIKDIKDGVYYKSEKVPSQIYTDVTRILSE